MDRYYPNPTTCTSIFYICILLHVNFIGNIFRSGDSGDDDDEIVAETMISSVQVELDITGSVENRRSPSPLATAVRETTPLSPLPQHCKHDNHHPVVLRRGSAASSGGGSVQSLGALASQTSFRRSSGYHAASRTTNSARGADDLDGSEHSDFSSVVDGFVEEENSALTGMRLEHLEKILSKINQTFEADELVFTPRVEQVSAPNNVDFCEMSESRVRRLPDLQKEVLKWRHLAQQLQLPAEVVIFMAKGIVHRRFFD